MGNTAGVCLSFRMADSEAAHENERQRNPAIDRVLERQTQARRPFFAYATLTQPHLPTLPNPAFVGKSGNGDWADMLAEMDHNVGQMLDAVDRLGIRDNTIVIFASDECRPFCDITSRAPHVRFRG